jgi:uncharacterized protein
MFTVGRFNTLKVIKQLDFGVYLDGDELGEILLPKRYVPEGCGIGDEVDIFLYFDSSDRIIATTEIPLAQVGEFALMRVKSVDEYGAFLEWGLMKDLLVPFREQKVTMTEDRSYLVYVFYDQVSNRIAASAKLEKFLHETPQEYKTGQQVELLIWKKTEIGYKAIIENSYQGVLYSNEVFQELKTGQKINGYIKKVREDGKIDLSLFPLGYDNAVPHADKITQYLKAHGGYATITDKTPPETIYLLFGISKKAFKMTLGNLYKQGVLRLEKEGIRLVEGNDPAS